MLIMLCGSAVVAAAPELHKLFAEYDEWVLREFPGTAMSRGDYSRADQLSDNSLSAIQRRHAERQQFLQRLHGVERGGLVDDDRLNYDLFEWDLKSDIDGHRFRTYLMPIEARGGIHQEVAQMAERVRFESLSDYQNYLKRLAQVPRRVDNVIALLKEGLQAGLTPPAIVMRSVPGQLQALLTASSGAADGREGLLELRDPLVKMQDKLSPQSSGAMLQSFDQEVYPALRVALQRLQNFLQQDYLPKCRDSIAAAALPDGEAFYRHRLRVNTTTDLSARQIHELGLSEVARIRAEMLSVIRSTDWYSRDGHDQLTDAKLMPPFLQYLRTDPRFYYSRPEELLAGYRDVCKQIDAWMPKFFHKLPRLSYGVREIPAFMAPNQTTAYYSQGDIRNGEPGYFYANTYALNQRPRYEMRALAIHEAVPGHHHQVALAQELDGLPEFRKELWVTAFGEGWALYSERLGIEAGFYNDPYDNFGRLTYEMWRACRLVVDPGLHALGWTREQALAFMKENTALSELNIEAEVDRYIAWPGQATAYKVGELKIRALREKAARELGDGFDLRAFHDRVLSAGCIPLQVLEQRIDDWIRETATRKPSDAAARQ